MDKSEFIEKIADRYAPIMKSEMINLLKEDYNTVLEDNIDFDLLFQTYLEEYSNKTYPPPAWFKQRAKRKIIQSDTKTEIRDLIVVLADGTEYQFAYQHPFETERQAIEDIVRRFYKKDYKLYRVIKEYDFEKDNNGIEKGWFRYRQEISLG